jgi:hypothetical protein
VRYTKELKELVLSTDAYKEQRQLNRIIYKNQLLDDFYEIKESFNEKYELKAWECIEALADSKRKKAKRIKKRNTTIIQHGDAYFLTLTFTDHTLASTTEKTRRIYVSRYLKEISSYYVANIDYGKTTQREHYHAVINMPHSKIKWLYGHSLAKKIRDREIDNTRTSKYMSKISNHALKDSGRFKRLIYSRKVV